MSLFTIVTSLAENSVDFRQRNAMLPRVMLNFVIPMLQTRIVFYENKVRTIG